MLSFLTHTATFRPLYWRCRRLIRQIIGRDVWAQPELSVPSSIVGNPGASWCVSYTELHKDSIVYSLGVGTDISFDRELIARTGAIVHAFDPTPRSVEWIRTQHLPIEFVFHELGVADYDGFAYFAPPLNATHVSFSIERKSSPATRQAGVDRQVSRLDTIMKMLGHDRIDVLKMDIEGSEYAVLATVLRERLNIRQILVEFHHRFPEIGRRRTQDALKKLHRAGYRVFFISENGDDYSLIKK